MVNFTKPNNRGAWNNRGHGNSIFSIMINIPKKLTLYSYNMVILMTSMFLRVKRTQGRRDYAFKLIKYFKSYDILKVNQIEF